ncbi:hypothetical protein TRVL_02285 [Trypanosoma vivax]|nr:hypothetical protein TRVL_02285 [Trypanosoma vivax]
MNGKSVYCQCGAHLLCSSQSRECTPLVRMKHLVAQPETCAHRIYADCHGKTEYEVIMRRACAAHKTSQLFNTRICGHIKRPASTANNNNKKIISTCGDYRNQMRLSTLQQFVSSSKGSTKGPTKELFACEQPWMVTGT